MSNIMKVKKESVELANLMEDFGEDSPEVSAALEKLLQDGQAGVAILTDTYDEIIAIATARSNKASELSALAIKGMQRAEKVKKYITRIMEIMGVDKITLGGAVITYSKGRESLEIVDPDLVPDTYKRAKITLNASDASLLDGVVDYKVNSIDIDKTAIKALHKESGGKMGIAGTQVVRTPYITIKGGV
jgi:hypothetical protein